jgi:hypothetical protein
MRIAICLLTLSIFSSFSYPQQPSPKPPAEPPTLNETAQNKHAKELVELMGVRQRMLDGRDKMAQAGKDAMLKNTPTADPAFIEEWGKRMRARINVDDYVDVVVQTYEKHFDDADLIELIQAQRDTNESKTPSISPHLKEKLNSVLVTVQSEILGGCAQLGAKLGGDIALEIEKERPDWAATLVAPKTAPASNQ